MGDSPADNLADSPDYKEEACNLCRKNWPCSERNKKERASFSGRGLEGRGQ